MILSEGLEGSAKYSDEVMQVSIELSVSTFNPPSSSALMSAVQNVLHGALTSLGQTGVEASIAAWHESMAAESREAKEF